jgi:hypothetical protein
MRRSKLLIATVVALSLLCFFTIPTASAQPLDGVWFKLNGRFQGYAVNPISGNAERSKGRGIAYLGFLWNGVSLYSYAVYTQQDVGWAYSSGGEYTPDFDYFFTDWHWDWLGEGGFSINIYHTAGITPAARGFRYQGWGEVVDGDDGDGNILYGGVSIKGRSIDPSKLPFPPVVPVPP